MIGPIALVGLIALVGGTTMPQERDELMRVARSIMNEAGNCALITRAPDGSARARAMDPFPPEEDLVVWMATHPATRKVAEIRAEPRASLYYFDASGGGYVTLVGIAEIVDDPETRARYWKPAWEPFYDRENQGDDYVLIRFVPDRAEIVSLRHGVASEPRAWRPAVLELRAR